MSPRWSNWTARPGTPNASTQACLPPTRTPPILPHLGKGAHQAVQEGKGMVVGQLSQRLEWAARHVLCVVVQRIAVPHPAAGGEAGGVNAAAGEAGSTVRARGWGAGGTQREQAVCCGLTQVAAAPVWPPSTQIPGQPLTASHAPSTRCCPPTAAACLWRWWGSARRPPRASPPAAPGGRGRPTPWCR